MQCECKVKKLLKYLLSAPSAHAIIEMSACWIEWFNQALNMVSNAKWKSDLHLFSKRFHIFIVSGKQNFLRNIVSAYALLFFYRSICSVALKINSLKSVKTATTHKIAFDKTFDVMKVHRQPFAMHLFRSNKRDIKSNLCCIPSMLYTIKPFIPYQRNRQTYWQT